MDMDFTNLIHVNLYCVVSANLAVTIPGPEGLTAPLFWPELPDVIRADEEDDAELYCIASGFPPPRVQ